MVIPALRGTSKGSKIFIVASLKPAICRTYLLPGIQTELYRPHRLFLKEYARIFFNEHDVAEVNRKYEENKKFRILFKIVPTVQSSPKI